jgi:hypothetical protein
MNKPRTHPALVANVFETSVVNTNNGFGTGYAVRLMNQLAPA